MDLLLRPLCKIVCSSLVVFFGLLLPVLMLLSGEADILAVLIVTLVLMMIHRSARKWLEHDRMVLRPYTPKKPRKAPAKVKPEAAPPLVTLAIRSEGIAKADYAELTARLPPELNRLVGDSLQRLRAPSSH